MLFAYLDSCIAIYFIERAPVLYQRINAALRGPSARARAVVSDLTRLECRVGALRSSDAALLVRYDDFFSLSTVGRAELDAAVYDLATNLRAEHGLQTPDALHLAAAIRSGCDEFWTRDRRLALAAGTQLHVVTFDQTP